MKDSLTLKIARKLCLSLVLLLIPSSGLACGFRFGRQTTPHGPCSPSSDRRLSRNMMQLGSINTERVRVRVPILPLGRMGPFDIR